MTLLESFCRSHAFALGCRLATGATLAEMALLIEELATVHVDFLMCLEERWPA